MTVPRLRLARRGRRAWKTGPVKPGWLFVVTQAVLISPYPAREGGPTGAEADAILEMQRSLLVDPVTVWVDSESGEAEARTSAPAGAAAQSRPVGDGPDATLSPRGLSYGLGRFARTIGLGIFAAATR